MGDVRHELFTHNGDSKRKRRNLTRGKHALRRDNVTVVNHRRPPLSACACRADCDHKLYIEFTDHCCKSDTHGQADTADRRIHTSSVL